MVKRPRRMSDWEAFLWLTALGVAELVVALAAIGVFRAMRHGGNPW
jgi:hypothetical protein